MEIRDGKSKNKVHFPFKRRERILNLYTIKSPSPFNMKYSLSYGRQHLVRLRTELFTFVLFVFGHCIIIESVASSEKRLFKYRVSYGAEDESLIAVC